MALTHAYAADITKSERDANGDLIVYGKATGPELDLDSQVCDPDWLRSAMPDWAKWGNIREMHQPIVAGIGLETAEDGDQWYVKSQVLDDGTAKKIEAGALKGYSVGIKNARVVKDATAPGGRIVGGTIVEISYVDRPCNPTATLALAKMAGDELELLDAPEAPEIPPEPVEADPLTLTDAERVEALEYVKAVGPDGSIDEKPDIDCAEHVLQLLAKLIIAEAQEMAVGQFDETCDIELLLCAANAIKCFKAREQRGDGEPADDEMPGLTTAYLAAEADLVKRKISASRRKELASEGKALPDGSYPIENEEDLHNAYLLARSGHGDVGAAKRLIAKRAKELGVANPFDGDKSKAADPDKTSGDDDSQQNDESIVGDLVKTAVAEAMKTYEAANGELRAELAKLRATPIPGTPFMTAPPGARDERAKNDQISKAAYYRRLADQVGDRELKTYYTKKAAEAESAAGLP